MPDHIAVQNSSCAAAVRSIRNLRPAALPVRRRWPIAARTSTWCACARTPRRGNAPASAGGSMPGRRTKPPNRRASLPWHRADRPLCVRPGVEAAAAGRAKSTRCSTRYCRIPSSTGSQRLRERGFQEASMRSGRMVTPADRGCDRGVEFIQRHPHDLGAAVSEAWAWRRRTSPGKCRHVRAVHGSAQGQGIANHRRNLGRSAHARSSGGGRRTVMIVAAITSLSSGDTNAGSHWQASAKRRGRRHQIPL